jgi:hypothetical protein
MTDERPGETPILFNVEPQNDSLVWTNPEDGSTIVEVASFKTHAEYLLDSLLEQSNVQKKGAKGINVLSSSKYDASQLDLLGELENMVAEIELRKISEAKDTDQLPEDSVITMGDILEWKGAKLGEGEFAPRQSFVGILNDSRCFKDKKFSKVDFTTFGNPLANLQFQFIHVYKPEEIGDSKSVLQKTIIKEIEQRYPEVAERIKPRETSLDRLDREVKAEVRRALLEERQKMRIYEPYKQKLKRRLLEDFAKENRWDYEFNSPSMFVEVETGLPMVIPAGTTVNLRNMDEEVEGTIPIGMEIKGGFYLHDQYMESSTTELLRFKKVGDGFSITGSKGDRIPKLSGKEGGDNTMPQGFIAQNITYNDKGRVKSIENNSGLWTDKDFRPQAVVIQLNGAYFRIEGKNIDEIQSISLGEEGNLICEGRYGDGYSIDSRILIEGLEIEKLEIGKDDEVTIVEAKSRDGKKQVSKLEKIYGSKIITTEQFGSKGEIVSKKSRVEKILLEAGYIENDDINLLGQKDIDEIEIEYTMQNMKMDPSRINFRRRPLFDKNNKYTEEERNNDLRIELQDGAYVNFNAAEIYNADRFIIKRTGMMREGKSISFTTRISAMSKSESLASIARVQLELGPDSLSPEGIYLLEDEYEDAPYFYPQDIGSAYTAAVNFDGGKINRIVLRHLGQRPQQKLAVLENISDEVLQKLKNGEKVAIMGKSEYTNLTIQFKDGKVTVMPAHIEA